MSLAVFGIYKAKVSVELDLEVQNILQEITVAVSWNQLEAALKAFSVCLSLRRKRKARRQVFW